MARTCGKVTRTGAFAGGPSFSPDGRHLVCYQADLSAVIDIWNPRRRRNNEESSAVDLATLQDKVIAGRARKIVARWLASGQVGYASGALGFVGGTPGARRKCSFSRARRGRLTANGSCFIEPATEWPREEHSRDPAFRLFRTAISPSVRTGRAPTFEISGTGLGPWPATAFCRCTRMARPPGDFDDAEKSAVAAVYQPTTSSIAFGWRDSPSGDGLEPGAVVMRTVRSRETGDVNDRLFQLSLMDGK